MENMSNLTKKDIPQPEGVAPTMKVPEIIGPPLDPAAVAPEPGSEKPVIPENPEAHITTPPDVPAGYTVKVEPSPAPVLPPMGSGIMSMEDAAKLGINAGDATEINIGAEQLEAEQRRYQEGQAAKAKAMQDMLAGALQEEEARAQRFENTENADEDTKRELLGEADPTVRQSVTFEQRMEDSKNSTNPELDPYDLMPGYSDDDIPEEQVEAEEKKAPEPADEEYGEYIRDLPVVQGKQFENPAVKTIRDIKVEITPSGRVNKAPLGDQAFLNALNKFKRDNFGKVTVVLPNSGFFADVVGTGVVDLQNLYMNVDQGMSTYDYQLEQMRTVIRNIVGTYPHVSANNVQNMIHFQDFQMLAFAHICATLRTVETVTNCTDCGKPLRISCRPNDLIMNMDEFTDRKVQIESAPNIEAYSLMTHNREVTTQMGIVVSLGHPSYADMIRCIRGFQEYSKNMTDTDRRRFESMLRLLYMIRKMKLPTGAFSNNIYQNYQALLLLSDADLEIINREATAMRDEIMVPRFGIKEAKCPHCGKIIKDIAYESLLELVFYHTTISSYLNNPES